MEDKYNQLSLEQYSRNLARILSDRYFAANQTINGQQLITFSPVKQINLFIIKELLVSWNKEMANLKSPYFDFEDLDVKDALKQFMNVLSRKILIKRPHFEPLLQKAIQDTFTLVLNPAASFETQFLQVQETASVPKMQELLKYIDLNKTVFTNFLGSLPTENPDKASVLQQLRQYLQTHAINLVSAEDLLKQLNGMLPVTKTDLLEKSEASNLQPAAEAASGPAFNVPVTPETPFANAPVPASGPTGPASFPETKPEPKPEAKPEITVPKPEPIAQPAAEMKAVSTATVPPTQTPEVKLYEKFKTDKPTLNESLKKPEAPILAEKDNRKVETLKESISINQRFAFINELFNGENLEYYEAIQKLDAFPDADSAKDYLLNDLASRHNWVKKEEHLNKLTRLIERKFAS